MDDLTQSGLYFYYCFDFEVGSYVAQDGLDLLILSPLPPGCQDYWHAPGSALCGSGDESQGITQAR